MTSQAKSNDVAASREALAQVAEDVAIHAEVEAVLAAAMGPMDDGMSHLALYEHALASRLGWKDAVAVSSDSGAITVLLGALNMAPGDAVLVCYAAPAWLFGALDQARVDVVGQTDIQAIPAGFGPEKLGRIRAVFCAPDGDGGDDLAGVRSMAVGLGVRLVLDLTCCLGTHAAITTRAGHAPIAFFSTGHDQGPFSTGEGGVLLFEDGDLGERARSFAQFGRLDGVHIGVNHKISPAQAALGQVRLEQAFPGSSGIKSGATFIKQAAPANSRLTDRFDPRSPADRAEVTLALAGDLSGAGEPVLRYERALERWFGAPHALSVSSGYAAVLVALSALGLQPGDEVLLAPTCPLCTVFALTAIGVIPVFCDTHRDSFSLDLDQARSRLSPRTRAVMDVPMWGYPVQADKTSQFAKAHGLFYVLDLALGHGTELDGQLIWKYADLATFSTHGSKILVTGEGGFVVCASPELAARVHAARHHGDRARGANYRLAGVQAALGIARLPLLSGHILRRRQLMDEIAGGLGNPHLAPFPQVSGGLACGVKMLIQERSGAGSSLNEHLATLGVPSDIRTYRCRPLYEFPVLSERRSECPNAASLLSSVATLPVHPGITPHMRDHIISALNSYRRRP